MPLYLLGRRWTRAGIIAIGLVAPEIAGIALLASQASLHPSPPVATGRISGRVLSSSAMSMTDVTVVLELQTFGVQRFASWTTRPATNGDFYFENVPDGQYTLSARKPAYSVESANTFDLLPGGHASGRDLTLRRTGSIVGRVFKPDSTTASGARVFLQSARAAGTSMFHPVTTDVEGRYRITDVPVGSYFVVTSDPGLVLDFALTFYPGAREKELATMVTVDEGEAVENIDFSVLGARYSVSGRLIDERGHVPRALEIEYGYTERAYRGLLPVTDVEGRFNLHDAQLRSGPLMLFAHGETDQGLVVGVITATLIEDIESSVDLVLGSPGRIRGRVLLPADVVGPPSRFRIAFHHTGFAPLGAIDQIIEASPDGWFTAENLLGQYRVRVLAPPAWTLKALRKDRSPVDADRVLISQGETINDLEVVVGPR